LHENMGNTSLRRCDANLAGCPIDKRSTIEYYSVERILYLGKIRNKLLLPDIV